MYAFHGEGIQTAITAGKRIRVMTSFPDSTELVEEYDAVTQSLECRRWRSSRPLCGTGDWEYEIGDPSALQGSLRAEFSPSSLNVRVRKMPSFHPRDTRKAWEWHIRNLPYPQATYSVSVDGSNENGQNDCLVLRTTNKKYFKRFKIPALVRAGTPLQESNATFSHDGGSTLIVTYIKPTTIVDEERQARASARQSAVHSNGVAAPSTSSSGGTQPAECKQS